MLVFDLCPAGNDRAKSFYKKAQVIIDGDRIILKSYDTFVCEIVNGEFYRLWGGYSATTMRHINSFLAVNNIPGGGKRWWDSLPVQK